MRSGQLGHRPRPELRLVLLKAANCFTLTCLGAVRVWIPVALATMVWLLPGLGCSDRVKPEMALTRISVTETLSSVTENADSPNTASMARGDSTCEDNRATLLPLHMTEERRLRRTALLCF